MARYTGPVRKLPTRIDIRCRGCKRRKTVVLNLADISKLRCRRCGASDPIVEGRTPLQNWSRFRKGK